LQFNDAMLKSSWLCYFCRSRHRLTDEFCPAEAHGEGCTQEHG